MRDIVSIISQGIVVFFSSNWHIDSKLLTYKDHWDPGLFYILHILYKLVEGFEGLCILTSLAVLLGCVFQPAFECCSLYLNKSSPEGSTLARKGTT